MNASAVRLVVYALLDANLAVADALDYHTNVSIMPSAEEWPAVHEAFVGWCKDHGGKLVNSLGDSTPTIDIHIGRRDYKPFAVLHVPEGTEVVYEVDEPEWRPADACEVAS